MWGFSRAHGDAARCLPVRKGNGRRKNRLGPLTPPEDDDDPHPPSRRSGWSTMLAAVAGKAQRRAVRHAPGARWQSGKSADTDEALLRLTSSGV